MSFTALQGDEKRWTALSFINTLGVAPFKAQLNVLWEELKLWTSTKTENMWQDVGLLCVWPELLASAACINMSNYTNSAVDRTVLTSVRASIPLVYPPSSPSCHTQLSGCFQPTFAAPYDTIFLPDNFLSLGVENVRNCNISWPDNRGFMRSSQSAQTAIEVLSVALNVFSMLSLRTIIVLHCTLSNGYCSSACHVSFITWICKLVSLFLNTHKLL